MLLLLAVRTPVRPEEQQHRLPTQRRKRRGLSAQVLAFLESRRGPAFEREQINIFLDPRPNGRGPVRRQVLAKQS